MMFSLSEKLGEARNKGELHRPFQHKYILHTFSVLVFGVEQCHRIKYNHLVCYF